MLRRHYGRTGTGTCTCNCCSATALVRHAATPQTGTSAEGRWSLHNITVVRMGLSRCGGSSSEELQLSFHSYVPGKGFWKMKGSCPRGGSHVSHNYKVSGNGRKH
jgi:hypothetical protein